MKKLLTFLLVSVSNILVAQTYPAWFLNPEKIPCTDALTMIIRSSVYPQSAMQTAFVEGCFTLARYKNSQISGGQAFWSTESGIFEMGSNYAIDFDSSLAERYFERLKITDSFTDNTKIVLLIADSACKFGDELFEKKNIKNIPEPKWIEQMPNEKGYIYAVGLSQEYVYEVSSWNSAERNGFLDLARQQKISLKSVQKHDVNEQHDLRNEDVNAQLTDVKVISRYRDLKRKIFYVLMRMKK